MLGCKETSGRTRIEKNKWSDEDWKRDKWTDESLTHSAAWIAPARRERESEMVLSGEAETVAHLA